MSNLSANVTQVDPTADPRMVAMVSDTRFAIHQVLTPLVMVIGVLGNCFSIVVLTRRRMRSPTNSYLTALAVSDTLYLLVSFTLSLMHVPGIRHTDHRQYWHYWPFGLWLIDSASNTSTWLTVAFTVERYIAVCHPIRGQVYCTESRARKTICAVYIICFLVTLSTPFEWEVVERKATGNSTEETEMAVQFNGLGLLAEYRLFFYWFTAVMFIFLPLLLLAAFNALLVCAVKDSHRERMVMCAGEEHSQSQENRITIMLIAVVMVYMICQLPHACFLIYTAFVDDPQPWSDEFHIHRILGNIFNFLMAINAACNFLLYCLLSDKYRKTFLLTFCSCRFGPVLGISAGFPTGYSTVSDFSRTWSRRSLSSSLRGSMRTQQQQQQQQQRAGRNRTDLLSIPATRVVLESGTNKLALPPAPPPSLATSEQAAPDSTLQPLVPHTKTQPRLKRLATWLGLGQTKQSTETIVLSTMDGDRADSNTPE